MLCRLLTCGYNQHVSKQVMVGRVGDASILLRES